jgi:hypothetical protein
MMIDTSTDALLEEAEAIVRAEWMRVRASGFFWPCTERPVGQTGATPMLVAVDLDQRGARQTDRGTQWSVRRRPRRVWPSERSPPDRNDPA